MVHVLFDDGKKKERKSEKSFGKQMKAVPTDLIAKRISAKGATTWYLVTAARSFAVKSGSLSFPMVMRLFREYGSLAYYI